MKKDDVLAKVKTLNLPQGEYVVYGAAPFAIYGIREVRDIDMLVSDKLYAELKEKGWEKIVKGPKDEPLTYDLFEAHDTWEFSPYAPTLEELLSRATLVDGIAFASIEDIRKWKAASARPKDLKDLELIDAYLAQK